MQETQETPFLLLGWENVLEKKMATHSSIPAWKTPWPEEPGGLQSGDRKESDTTEHTQGRNKTVIVCRWHECLCRKFKGINELLELNFRRSLEQKVNIQNTIAFKKIFQSSFMFTVKLIVRYRDFP